MIQQPILSICIPTYNRANLLQKTLDSIIAQPRFQDTNDVEIIVSDNCSTDNTAAIMNTYTQIHGSKIRYFCNKENIYDKNLEKSLSYGRGAFLKSHNDTLMLRDGALDKMCDFLQCHKDSEPIIFFLNSAQGDGKFEFNNANDFLSHISIYSTWIGGFGLWKSDFDKIDNFSRFAPQKLPQTDILFQMMEYKNKFAVLDDAVFTLQPVGQKGGYNIAEIFGNNYMILLRRLLNKKIISSRIFNRQMKKMLKHINHFYFDIKHEYAFVRGNYWKHMHDWHFRPSFYTHLAKVYVKSILTGKK